MGVSGVQESDGGSSLGVVYEWVGVRAKQGDHGGEISESVR